MATKEILVLRNKIRSAEDPTTSPSLPTPSFTLSLPKVKSLPILLQDNGDPQKDRLDEEQLMKSGQIKTSSLLPKKKNSADIC